MRETQVQSLGWEYPLEEGLATHSSIPAWRIPVGRGAWRAIIRGVTESDRTEQLGTAQHSTGAYTSQLVLPYKGPQTGWLTQQTQVFLQFCR